MAWIIYKGGVRVMWRGGYRIYSTSGEGRHEDCVSPTTMYLWIYIIINICYKNTDASLCLPLISDNATAPHKHVVFENPSWCHGSLSINHIMLLEDLG